MSKNEYKVGERAIYDARELGTGKMIWDFSTCSLCSAPQWSFR